MKISLNWLKDYIDLPSEVSPEKLAHDLTMATVEVEGFYNWSDSFAGMVVGKVVELKDHPQADRLKLALTDVGGEVKQIVCGGSNLFEGMLVAVALPGAKVKWHGEGSLVKLEKATIRGEKSFGMICAAEEIGLEQLFPSSEKEIINLSNLAVKPGMELSKALELDDVIFEIDNKSLTNRPDLWGHYGLARELSAIYHVPLRELPREKPDKKIKDLLSVKIKDPKSCFRYLGLIVDNITIKPSPLWLQSRLVAVGLRPINNIVDLTNYLMLEVGQPLHAFDYQLFPDNHLLVRKANPGEKIKVLDGTDIKLTVDDLVIADSKKPIALAGVMGGESSAIGQQTGKIVLEAATFDPVSIRRTSLRHNLRTDSSIRFEKGIDAERAELAVERFVYLLMKILPEAKCGAVKDEYVSKSKKVVIEVKIDKINGSLGQELEKAEIIDILHSLYFLVKEKNEKLVVTVPSWRATGDISIPEDIIEEVARIYGYDKLQFHPPTVKLISAVYQPEQILEKKVKEYLSGAGGMREVYNYPWAEKRIITAVGLDTKEMLQLDNPPTEDNKFLQNSLLTNLLKNIEDNLRFYDSFRIFELSRVYLLGIDVYEPGSDKLPLQPKMLAGAVVGGSVAQTFFELKGVLEGMSVFLKANVEFSEASSEVEFWHNSQNLGLTIAGKQIGRLGLLNPKVGKILNLNGKYVSLFEVDFSRLVNIYKENFDFSPLPKYPTTTYDLAVVFDQKVLWQQIEKQIRTSAEPLLKSINWFDQYTGSGVPAGKKSVAFSLIFSSPSSTLQSDEVEKIINKILEDLHDKLGGELRKQ